MNQSEASTWPFAALVIFSCLFLFGAVPAFVVGFMDKEYRVLFIILAVLIVPQIISLWVCTVLEYIASEAMKRV